MSYDEPNFDGTQFKACVAVRTCDEGEGGEACRTDGVVHQALGGQVGEGQEGGRVERLIAEVQGAEEAARARQQRPHTNRAPVDVAHCTHDGLSTVLLVVIYRVQTNQEGTMEVGDRLTTHRAPGSRWRSRACRSRRSRTR